MRLDKLNAILKRIEATYGGDMEVIVEGQQELEVMPITKAGVVILKAKLPESLAEFEGTQAESLARMVAAAKGGN